MLLLGVRPTDRAILAAALAIAAAATVALTSRYPDSGGWPVLDAPAAIHGAQAATASTAMPAPASAPARRKRDAPAPAMSPALRDQRGALLYLLIEAARPQPMFAQ